MHFERHMTINPGMDTFYDFLLGKTDFKKYPTSSFDIVYWRDVNYNEVDYNWRVRNPGGSKFTNPKYTYSKQNADAMIVDVRYLLPEGTTQFHETYEKILVRLKNLLKGTKKLQLLILISSQDSRIPMSKVYDTTFVERSSNLHTESSRLEPNNQFWFQILLKLRNYISTLREQTLTPFVVLDFDNIDGLVYRWDGKSYIPSSSRPSFLENTNDVIMKYAYDVFLKSRETRNPFELLIYQPRTQVAEQGLDVNLFMMYYRISALQTVLDFDLYLVDEKRMWNIKRLFIATIVNFRGMFDKFPGEPSYHIINSLIIVYCIWYTKHLEISLNEIFEMFNRYSIQQGNTSNTDFIFSIDFRNQIVNVGESTNELLRLIQQKVEPPSTFFWDKVLKSDLITTYLIEDYLENSTAEETKEELLEIGVSDEENIVLFFERRIFNLFKSGYLIERYGTDSKLKKRDPPLISLYNWFKDSIRKYIDTYFLPSISTFKIMEIHMDNKENIPLATKLITQYVMGLVPSRVTQRLLRVVLNQNNLSIETSLEKWKSRTYNEISMRLSSQDESFHESQLRLSTDLYTYEDYFGYTRYGMNDTGPITEEKSLQDSIKKFSDRYITTNVIMKGEQRDDVDRVSDDAYDNRARITSTSRFERTIIKDFVEDSILFDEYEKFTERSFTWINVLIKNELFPRIIRIGRRNINTNPPVEVVSSVLPKIKFNQGGLTYENLQDKTIEHNPYWNSLEEYYVFAFVRLFNTIPSGNNVPSEKVLIKYLRDENESKLLYLGEVELTIVCFVLSYAMITLDEIIQTLLTFDKVDLKSMKSKLSKLLNSISVEVIHRWSKIAVKVKRELGTKWIAFFLFILNNIYSKRKNFNTGKTIIKEIGKVTGRIDMMDQKLVREKDRTHIKDWLDKNTRFFNNERIYSIEVEISYLEYVFNNVFSGMKNIRNVVEIDFDPWFYQRTKIVEEDILFTTGDQPFREIKISNPQPGEPSKDFIVLDLLTNHSNIHTQWPSTGVIKQNEVQSFISLEYTRKDDTIKWLRKLRYLFENEYNVAGNMVEGTLSSTEDWVRNVKDWMLHGVLFQYKDPKTRLRGQKVISYKVRLDMASQLDIPSFKLSEFPYVNIYGYKLAENSGTYHCFFVSDIGKGVVITRQDIPKINDVTYIGSGTTIYGFITNSKTLIDPKKLADYLLTYHTDIFGLDNYQGPETYRSLIEKDQTRSFNDLLLVEEEFLKGITNWISSLPDNQQSLFGSALQANIKEIGFVEIPPNLIGVDEWVKSETITVRYFDPLFPIYYLGDVQLMYKMWLFAFMSDVRYIRSIKSVSVKEVLFEFYKKKYMGESQTLLLNMSSVNDWVDNVYIDEEDLKYNFPRTLFEMYSDSPDEKIDFDELKDYLNSFGVKVFDSNQTLLKEGKISIYPGSGLEIELLEEEREISLMKSELIKRSEYKDTMGRAIQIADAGDYVTEGRDVSEIPDETIQDLFRDTKELKQRRERLERDYESSSNPREKALFKRSLKELKDLAEIGNALFDEVIDSPYSLIPGLGFQSEEPYKTVYTILVSRRREVAPRTITDNLSKEKSIRRSVERKISSLRLFFDLENVTNLPTGWKKTYFNLWSLEKSTTDQIFIDTVTSFVLSIILLIKPDEVGIPNLLFPPRFKSFEEFIKKLNYDELTLKKVLEELTNREQTFNEFANRISNFFSVRVNVKVIRLINPTTRQIERIDDNDIAYGSEDDNPIDLLKYVKSKRTGSLVSNRTHFEPLRLD